MTTAPMRWPSLPLEQWQQTRDTVHLWTQMVGKTRLALAPPANHWWSAALYVTARGLTTSLMPYQGGGAEIEFDFTRHELAITTTSGAARRMPLAPRTVADFYAEYRSHLADLPNEIPDAVPFDADTASRCSGPGLPQRHGVTSRVLNARTVQQVHRMDGWIPVRHGRRKSGGQLSLSVP